MRHVALAFGTLIAIIGVIGIVVPSWWLAIARSFDTPLGLVAAAGVRLIMGAVLFLVAPRARTPTFLRVLGVVTFIAGLITPFFGVDRARRILEWWSASGAGVQRAWAAFAIALGVFLIWALSGPEHTKRGPV
jgi:hypothetical protein